jgi:hypothetical protein
MARWSTTTPGPPDPAPCAGEPTRGGAAGRHALSLDTANKRFVLDVDKERLEGAPGFDKQHWPDMADETWEKGIHAYYGTTPHNAGLRSARPLNGQRGN